MMQYRATRRGSRHNISRDVYLRDVGQYVARGQELPQTKLLPLDVLDIRSAKRQREKLLQHIKENLSNEALAKIYNVHVRTIEKALSRETHTQII